MMIPEFWSEITWWGFWAVALRPEVHDGYLLRSKAEKGELSCSYLLAWYAVMLPQRALFVWCSVRFLILVLPVLQQALRVE